MRKFLDGEVNEIDLVNVRQIKETFAQFKSVVNTMETDLEEKLREKIALQEKDLTTPGNAVIVTAKGQYAFY